MLRAYASILIFVSLISPQIKFERRSWQKVTCFGYAVRTWAIEAVHKGCCGRIELASPLPHALITRHVSGPDVGNLSLDEWIITPFETNVPSFPAERDMLEHVRHYVLVASRLGVSLSSVPSRLPQWFLTTCSVFSHAEMTHIKNSEFHFLFDSNVRWDVWSRSKWLGSGILNLNSTVSFWPIFDTHFPLHKA